MTYFQTSMSTTEQEAQGTGENTSPHHFALGRGVVGNMQQKKYKMSACSTEEQKGEPRETENTRDNEVTPGNCM